MSSPIIKFYLGERADSKAPSLAVILSWDKSLLEDNHDYIQWLFPLPEPSLFNPSAPLLTDEDIRRFNSDVNLREKLIQSFRLMLDFYGFAFADNKIVPSPFLQERSDNWLHPGNHNMMRITRILRSLTLLGCRDQAREFLRALVNTHSKSPAMPLETWAYWNDALRSANS